MTRDEVINTLVTYLDQHLKGGRGYMGQPHYKDDIFKLFHEAYTQGYFETSPNMHADNIRDLLLERWEDRTPERDNEKFALINQWSALWDEWRYAWDHYPSRP